MKKHLGKRVNIERADEALATNAEKIATGCPFCRVMIFDGVTARQETGKGEGAEVVDVAMMLLGSVKRGLPDRVIVGSKRSPSVFGCVPWYGAMRGRPRLTDSAFWGIFGFSGGHCRDLNV
ncbi:Putative iron-sulfur binding reductase (plasmid) [Hoyosella subflava DQS3-9A1]|uniref:Putative iron-sulfur binding reductase n=1 Tax=Hoyosella subflava (strain DSM 45089 / JCM 17490 / NBRC 109087 / DQS3-9A1) TaxID=443218 RepID=F6ESD1_HOYSD|nr:Putative iron-sulfur binding reductase [Hoyosella subflava DQS3-9A1]